MTALNDVILHEDIRLILKHFLVTDIKLSQLLDAHNNTVLHVAAYAGRIKLVETLLQFISDSPNFKNVYGQTPRHLAMQGGYTNIASLFPLNNNEDGTVENGGDNGGANDRRAVTEFEQLNWKRYLNSGWNVEQHSLDDLNSSYSLCSQVLPIVKKLNKKIMSHHHMPLLIYSQDMGEKKWNAWRNWRKRDLIERYGVCVCACVCVVTTSKTIIYRPSKAIICCHINSNCLVMSIITNNLR